jgi:hypothetical protein
MTFTEPSNMKEIKLLVLLINTRDFHVKVKFNEKITPCIAISIMAVNRRNRISSMIPHEPATQYESTQYEWYVELILIRPEQF